MPGNVKIFKTRNVSIHLASPFLAVSQFQRIKCFKYNLPAYFTTTTV